MEPAEWLRSLGLEQYEATFRESAIDETVLRDLSEDHLRELVSPAPDCRGFDHVEDA